MARGEREGYGEPRDVTSLSLSQGTFRYSALPICRSADESATRRGDALRDASPQGPAHQETGNRDKIKERTTYSAGASPSSATSSTGGFCMTQSV